MTFDLDLILRVGHEIIRLTFDPTIRLIMDQGMTIVRT